MPRIKKNYVDVFGSLLADSGLLLAAVAFDNMSTGEPVVNLIFPNNPNGVDLPLIKDALRERCVILRFSSPDGREFVEIRVNHENDVLFHLERPKKKKFSSKNVK
jgi:hypothetical protein